MGSLWSHLLLLHGHIIPSRAMLRWANSPTLLSSHRIDAGVTPSSHEAHPADTPSNEPKAPLLTEQRR